VIIETKPVLLILCSIQDTHSHKSKLQSITMTKITEYTNQRTILFYWAASHFQLTSKEFTEILITFEVSDSCFRHVAMTQTNIKAANWLSCPHWQIYAVHSTPET